MRLETIEVKNFRCYREPVVASFADLTTFVGKNDIGKSTILEALEIFFNNDTVKVEQGDANVYSNDQVVTITCEFSDLPEMLSLDAGAETSLASEYLLTSQGTLKIKKVFDCSKKNPSVEIYIVALHPTATGVENLLELKEKELQQIVKQRDLSVPLKGNPGMRQAIWASAGNLELADVDVPVSKAKEDSKRIWEQIDVHLPIYALFQSDRASRDSDDEVQEPMKAAVAAAIAEVQTEIDEIQRKVKEKAVAIARATHEALKTIDPTLAKELKPEFTAPTTSKWTGLFAVNMATEDGIPLNKRGSGVRRLILVSFFKAEAERRLASSQKRSIIYGIEEPETAQHPNNQKVLISAFKALSSEPGCQILLTTHSPGFAAELPVDSVRFVTRSANGDPVIEEGVDVFGKVADTLGVVPDSRVKVMLCVEGPTDVTAFKSLSHALHLEDPTIPDLSSDERVAFVVLGGGTLKHWVAEHYLKALRYPEVHIYDSDVPDYAVQVDAVNRRGDNRGSWAVQTLKHEIESYLHPQAIRDAFGFEIAVFDHPREDGKAVPKLFGEAYAAARGHGAPLKDSNSKAKLAEQAFPRMTAAMIRERDPDGEVEGWLRRISEML